VVTGNGLSIPLNELHPDVTVPKDKPAAAAS